MEKYLKSENPELAFTATEEASFYELLDIIHKTDKWEFVDIPDITIACKAEDPEEIESKKKLFMTLNGNEYRVLPQAMHSIERRAMDEAKVNDKLPLDIRVRRLNEDFSVAYKKKDHVPLCAKGLVRGGNLLALLSERYVPFTQKQIFDVFSFALSINFEKVLFKSSSYTHSLTEAVYEIYDSDLIDPYREILESVKHPYADKDIYLKIILSTTDIGVSSIAVLPLICFEDIKANVPINEPIKVEHRDTTVFSDVEKAFMSIFSITEIGMKKLPELLKITINHPVDCAQNIAQKLQLPKAEVDELENQLSSYTSSKTPLTAHEFFFIISDIINTKRYKELHPTKKIFIRDNLSKMVLFDKDDWAKFDKPRK